LTALFYLHINYGTPKQETDITKSNLYNKKKVNSSYFESRTSDIKEER